MATKNKILKWSQFYILILFFMLIQLSSSKALSTNELKIILDGKDITEIAKPVNQMGRILVPIRAIAEQMDAKVDWNGDSRTALIEKDGNSVFLRIDSYLVTYEKDGKLYGLSDVPPTIINESTYLPLRLVSNALGIGIKWDGDKNAVYIDSNKTSDITPFFDMKISSIKFGQAITGITDLQIEISDDEIKNAYEIKYLLLDPNTAKGTVIARGNRLTDKYSWVPNLEESGERVLVAAIYDNEGQFLAGDSIPVYVDVVPKVSLTGLSQDQVIDGTVSLSTDVNFVASYVKYEITNLDNDKVTLSSEWDPYGVYNWTPNFEDKGNYSFKVIAYDNNNQEYDSETLTAKVDVGRKLSLLGVKDGQTIDKAITLSTSRNFNVSETEYVLKDLNTGKEEVLAKMGYGSYKWFPGPEYKGSKELFVRVKDTRGVTHKSDRISVNLEGSARIYLGGIGPKQVVTGPISLKTTSNVALDKVNYIFINPTTDDKKVIASSQDPSIEYNYTPTSEDDGSWKVYAEGIYGSGKKIVSEEIPFTIYLGETYSSSPIVEKDKFLGLASELAKDSWGKTGMSAALQTAQAILETGWGQSVPVDKYSGNLSYNLFGIKGAGTQGSVISNTWEEYNGKTFRVDAEFRAYNNIEESWMDHKNLLLNASRYEPFREVMHDSTLGAWAIRRAGYATDSQYPIKLMRIIKQYNLQELDKVGI